MTSMDLQISVPTDLLIEALVKKLTNNNLTVLQRDATIPRIGDYWPGQGGIYAGLQRGNAGETDYHLIVGPAIDPCNWKTAKEKTAAVEVDGHRDFCLPLRKEQALQFANVPELFEKEWYWSNEEHASDSTYAWSQYFDSGHQDYYRKRDENRARAIRRIFSQAAA